jgi:hypothetical protein
MKHQRSFAMLCVALFLLAITVSAAVCVHLIRKPHHTKATIQGWHKWCETHDCSKPTRAEASKTLDFACSFFEPLPVEEASPLLVEDAVASPPSFDVIQLPTFPSAASLGPVVATETSYPIAYPPFTTPIAPQVAIAAAPEPVSLVLCGTGFFGLAIAAVRSRRRL